MRTLRIKWEYVVGILGLMLTIMVALIEAWAAFYTIPNTDDFSLANDWMQYRSQCSTDFGASIVQTVNMWLTHGGTYFDILGVAFTNPLNKRSYSGLGIIASVCVMFFCAMAGIFLFNLARSIVNDICVAFIIQGCVIWTFFNYNIWTEPMFWLTGIMDYVVPLGSFLALANLLNLRKNQTSLSYIFCIILGFIAMGGSQSIAFAGLFYLLFNFFREKKEHTLSEGKWGSYIIFFGFVALNLIAPGNFARSKLGYETTNQVWISYIWFPFRTMIIQSQKLFKDSAFILVFTICIICGFLKSTSTKSKRGIFWVIVFLVMHLSVGFISSVGYKSPYLPNRQLFVADFFLVCMYVFGGMLIGKSVKNDIEKYMGALRALVCGYFITVACLMPYRIEYGNIYNLGKELVSGELKNYKDSITLLYDQIDCNENKNVIIVSVPEGKKNFMNIVLAREKDYFANQAVAKYYGKESVSVADGAWVNPDYFANLGE